MSLLTSRTTSRASRPRRTWRSALVAIVALAPVAGLLVAAPSASAAPDKVHKSYVCKYVGTPGIDERLQTGHNPIWVDNHSLTGKLDSTVQVGDTFQDKHGRSVVIVANTPKLNPEPGIDKCPAPVGPIKVTATPPTVTPATCDSAGTLTLPADTAKIHYTVKPTYTGPGSYVVTATAQPGYVIDGASTFPVTVDPKKTEGCSSTTTVTATAPSATDPTCTADGKLVVAADTAAIHYSWTPSGTGPATYTVTATAKTGYVLSGTTTWTVTVKPKLSAETCATIVVVTPVNPTVTQSTKCEVEGSFVIPSTAGVTYLYEGKVIAAGKHSGPAFGKVTAQAQAGYTLSNASWSYQLSLAPSAVCPSTEAPVTGGGSSSSSPSETLPKTGAASPAIAALGALALALGVVLYVVGARRPATHRSQIR